MVSAGGGEAVGILLADREEVLAVAPDGEARPTRGERVLCRASVPGLEPPVDELFARIATRR